MNSAKSILAARVVSLCSLAFLLVGSYAIARPAIDSLFLEHYHSSDLPWVWVATAIVTALVMVVYNRYNQHYSLLKLFGFSCIATSIVLIVLILAYERAFQWSIVLLYVWKEIYMVLLIEIFWSFADVVFSIRNARWIYGLLLGVGSFGGIVGNYMVGPMALQIGSAKVLWWILPVLMSCWIISILFAQSAQDPVPLKKRRSKGMGHSLNVVLKSEYLLPLLFLVAAVQSAVTLIDFEFNTMLQQTFTDVDARTNVLGKTHAIIDVIAVALQLFTAPILRLLGVASTLVSIPVVIGASVVGALAFPSLLAVIITKIASKCLDYSIFRAAKEILYIPLGHEEKTQGKALIDILVYRIAKGLSSLLLLGLLWARWVGLTLHIALVFLGMWALLTLVIVKRYRKIVSREQEFTGEING